MKIASNDYRVRPDTKVKLDEWPTLCEPFCKSKKKYRELLGHGGPAIVGRRAESALMLLLEDQHEHLGQSIAYARSNGVVPPSSR